MAVHTLSPEARAASDHALVEHVLAGAAALSLVAMLVISLLIGSSPRWECDPALRSCTTELADGREVRTDHGEAGELEAAVVAGRSGPRELGTVAARRLIQQQGLAIPDPTA
jgi:hypothetical protein